MKPRSVPWVCALRAQKERDWYLGLSEPSCWPLVNEGPEEAYAEPELWLIKELAGIIPREQWVHVLRIFFLTLKDKCMERVFNENVKVASANSTLTSSRAVLDLIELLSLKTAGACVLAHAHHIHIQTHVHTHTHTQGGGIFLFQSFKRVPSICGVAETIMYSASVYSRTVDHEAGVSQEKRGTHVVGWASEGQESVRGGCPASICVSFVWSDATRAAICLIQLTDVLRSSQPASLVCFLFAELTFKNRLGSHSKLWFPLDPHEKTSRSPVLVATLPTQRPVLNNVPIVHGLHHACPQ